MGEDFVSRSPFKHLSADSSRKKGRVLLVRCSEKFSSFADWRHGGRGYRDDLLSWRFVTSICSYLRCRVRTTSSLTALLICRQCCLSSSEASLSSFDSLMIRSCSSSPLFIRR